MNDIIIAIYAIFFSSDFTEVLRTAFTDNKSHIALGCLILAINLIEVIGLRWKCLFVRKRAAMNNQEPEGSMLFIFSATAISHVITSCFLGMLALDCFGFTGKEEGISSALFAAGFILVVFKEFAAFFATAGNSQAAEAVGHHKERIAETILLLYSMLGYTAWWKVFINLEEFQQPTIEALIVLPVICILFVFFSLPLRLSSLFDEYYLNKSFKRKRRLIKESCMGMLLGIAPVVIRWIT